MINENIALAKSILRKQSILETDEDYLKIKELVGNSFGYVGILTRLRYVDNVTDFEEIKSIFEVLKNSKIDISKLNKLSYDEILDTFYDELIIKSDSKNKEDYELIYKDTTYSYFRVHTYKGILEIGSPAWCLKTKSNWDNYQDKYPEQWVAIDNRYVKNIITPNSSYLSGQYINAKKAWIRFGVSIKHNDDNTVSWVGHNDNDGRCTLAASNCTFFGVFYTILNLSNGVNKSYYEKFAKSEPLFGSTLKITDNLTWERLGINPKAIKSICEEGDVAYLLLSKTYSYVPVAVVLKKDSVPYVMAFTSKKEIIEPVNIGSITDPTNTGKEIIKYINEPRSAQYIGMRIKLGFITLEQAIDNPAYVCKYNNWLVYNWNDSYYIVVNSDPKDFIFPTTDTSLNFYWNSKEFKNKPIFYLVDKSNMKSDFKTDELGGVVKAIESVRKPVEKKIEKPVEKPAEKQTPKVGGFWDFIKKRPLL